MSIHAQSIGKNLCSPVGDFFVSLISFKHHNMMFSIQSLQAPSSIRPKLADVTESDIDNLNPQGM